MDATTDAFRENAHRALADLRLQKVINTVGHGFQIKRRQAAARLPEFEELRDQARDIKNHVLEHLDIYLEQFEGKVAAAGGTVHWARDAHEACEQILGICRSVDARVVTKGKSMIAEEIGLNEHLSANGLEPVETDLGEYIIQLRHEPPSHIIAPAVHLSKEDVAETFRMHHLQLPRERELNDARTLVNEAREVLRKRFQDADVGITGANFLIAETGSTVIVTNEGNGDLTQTLPKVHIVLASLEKVVPTLEDATTILRLLARSATGQEFSAYTTFSTGPRRPGDADGPEQFHVVLLDNGRTDLLGSPLQEVLRCIRCGACMNHCPVYHAVGGHAYGWVYPGPIGAVLDPALLGLEKAGHLPNASTLCGRCESVCPMRIPLPSMMRHWRNEQFRRNMVSPLVQKALAAWAWLATRPVLYHQAMRLAMPVLGLLGRRKGRFRHLPFAGEWTAARDLPAPQGKTFQQLWAERKR